MVDYFMVYNLKIWWVDAYRGLGGYYNEYGYSVAHIYLPAACLLSEVLHRKEH